MLRNFNNDYPEIARQIGGPERWLMEAKNEGGIAVAQLSDFGPEQKAMERKHAGDLMTGTPSIKITIGGKEHYLTWAEAYNLGYALQRVADVSFYG